MELLAFNIALWIFIGAIALEKIAKQLKRIADNLEKEG